MIERVEGIVDALIDGGIIVRMGSVYLSLQVPRAFGITPGSAITLYTQLIWNQETGPQLFGFLAPLDRTVFLLVTDCSGIGPKLALALLEQLGPDVVITALYEGDEKVLSSVSGIGTKKAEHMIVHLKTKAHKLIKTGQISNTASVSYLHEVDSALQSLLLTSFCDAHSPISPINSNRLKVFHGIYSIVEMDQWDALCGSYHHSFFWCSSIFYLSD
jgi:Holliday junction DNA helicase RuvA